MGSSSNAGIDWEHSSRAIAFPCHKENNPPQNLLNAGTPPQKVTNLQIREVFLKDFRPCLRIYT
jgi:hypothetical protein